MALMYRVIGLVAKLNQRLSRTRINLVPLNWAAMGGLGVLLAISLAGWQDAHANGQAPRTMTDMDPAQGADVRVTGAFVLDGKTSQRFLDMPSGYGTLESGETIFASNIDASNRFMGITTAKRAGTWTIVLKNGSARVGDHGLLYAGTAVRPALKLSYVEAATGKPAQAVLSFGTERERARVLALLETPRPAWG